jgi:hypothetical protein
MFRKIGYVLFAGGLALMLWTLVSGTRMFSGATPPPVLVSLPAAQLPVAGMQVEVPFTAGLGKALNVLLKLFYLMFMLGAGHKLANMGFMLMNGRFDQPEEEKKEPGK